MSKKDSFRSIDYSLRPAKYAERRMLCDIFRRLSSFSPVENYRYVGLGSVWFSDFILFHRALGIRNMLSIERSVASKSRFEANKPYWIDIDFRSSTHVLPGLDYSGKNFLWLDYDDTITFDMLLDVSAIASRIQSGSALALSVQCVRAPDVAEATRARETDPSALSAVERFRARMQGDRVSPDIQETDLAGWSFGKLSRELFYAEIDRVLANRKMSNPDDDLTYRTICDFEYEDGAKMTTLAVVFYTKADEQKLNACRFEALEFLNPTGEPVYIHAPKLTLREIHFLQSQLPLTPDRELVIGSIPESEAGQFSSMYRYFPNFAAIET